MGHGCLYLWDVNLRKTIWCYVDAAISVQNSTWRGNVWIIWKSIMFYKTDYKTGHHSRDHMVDLQQPMQSVPITTKVRIQFMAECTRYNIMY